MPRGFSFFIMASSSAVWHDPRHEETLIYRHRFPVSCINLLGWRYLPRKSGQHNRWRHNQDPQQQRTGPDTTLRNRYPERRQAFGNKAKQFTAGMVFKKTVLVIPMDTDRYGRTVALVQIASEKRSLNEALVAAGFAWVYRKYCRAGFCEDWLDLERDAREAGHGLWADPHPIPPWEYRR